MHAQAEGVPFIVEEMARAYRDGGMVQQIDGMWRLAGNTERLVPSAVRTLISRRAAHLPDDTKVLLADAAVLGRRFSLEDLREVEARVAGGAPAPDQDALAGALVPAVTAGLLDEHGEDAAADYSFPHEQVREFAADDAHARAAPRDPRGDRRAAAVGRAVARKPAAARAPREGRRRRRPCASGSRSKRAGTRWRRTRPRRSCASSRWRLPVCGLDPRSGSNCWRRAISAFDMLRRPDRPARGPRRARRAGRGARRLAPRARRSAAACRRAADRRGVRPRPRSSRARCGRWPRSGAIAEASWPRAWSSGRTSCMPRPARRSSPPHARSTSTAPRRRSARAVELGDGSSATTRRWPRRYARARRRRSSAGSERGSSTGRDRRPSSRSPSAWRRARCSRTSCPSCRSRRSSQETRGLLQRALELFERLGDRRGAMATIIAHRAT